MQILISDTEVSMDPPMSAAAVTNQLLSVLYHMYNHTVQNAPEDKKEELRVHLYDAFNDAASEFLTRLIPDKELRPDLTAEAIMAMENQILDNLPDHSLDEVTHPHIIVVKDEE